MTQDQEAKDSVSPRTAVRGRAASAPRWQGASDPAAGRRFEGEDAEPCAELGRRPPRSVRLVVAILASLALWVLLVAGARLLFS